MRDTSCVALRQRYQALKGNRRRVESVWEEIENYVLPFRGQMFKDDLTETDVEWRKRWIFDSVPVESCQQLAASLNGSLTSPLIKWFALRFRQHELNRDKDAKEWLQDCEDRCWYALLDSNFNLEINEAYLELVGLGNTVLTEEIDGTYEDFRGLNFKAVPIKEVFFEEDFKGRVKHFYRRVFMTPVQIVDKFGDKVPESIKERAESAEAVDDKVEIVFCIFEREEIMKLVQAGKVNTGKVLTPERRPYGYKWFVNETAEELGSEGGYYEMPAYIVRWSKVSGSKWGHGPAHIAMGDILTLNQMVNYILSASEKVIDPATLVTNRGVIGDLDLSAGAVTTIRDPAAVRPYESAARFDVSQLQRQELRDSIRRMFFVDQLEMKESPAMTATEVNVRYELMQRMLGPTVGRLGTDLFDPCISRTFNILYRSNRLPPAPEAVIEAGAEMDIEYLGPLSRAQKSDQVANIERYVATLGGMAQFAPEVLDVLDPVETANEVADLLTVPARIRRSEKQLKELAAKRQQQQKQAMMIQQMGEGGAAAEQAGKGIQALKEATGGQEAA